MEGEGEEGGDADESILNNGTYERERLANIARNQTMLKFLGLDKGSAVILNDGELMPPAKKSRCQTGERERAFSCRLASRSRKAAQRHVDMGRRVGVCGAATAEDESEGEGGTLPPTPGAPGSISGVLPGSEALSLSSRSSGHSEGSGSGSEYCKFAIVAKLGHPEGSG